MIKRLVRLSIIGILLILISGFSGFLINQVAVVSALDTEVSGGGKSVPGVQPGKTIKIDLEDLTIEMGQDFNSPGRDVVFESIDITLHNPPNINVKFNTNRIPTITNNWASTTVDNIGVSTDKISIQVSGTYGSGRYGDMYRYAYAGDTMIIKNIGIIVEPKQKIKDNITVTTTLKVEPNRTFGFSDNEGETISITFGLSPGYIRGTPIKTFDFDVSFTSTLLTITNWLFYLLVYAGIIAVVWSAWRFIASSREGNEQGIETAKKIIVYAVIAIIVGILAKSIVNFVLGMMNQKI